MNIEKAIIESIVTGKVIDILEKVPPDDLVDKLAVLRQIISVVPLEVKVNDAWKIKAICGYVGRAVDFYENRILWQREFPEPLSFPQEVRSSDGYFYITIDRIEYVFDKANGSYLYCGHSDIYIAY